MIDSLESGEHRMIRNPLEVVLANVLKRHKERSASLAFRKAQQVFALFHVGSSPYNPSCCYAGRALQAGRQASEAFRTPLGYYSPHSKVYRCGRGTAAPFFCSPCFFLPSSECLLNGGRSRDFRSFNCLMISLSKCLLGKQAAHHSPLRPGSSSHHRENQLRGDGLFHT